MHRIVLRQDAQVSSTLVRLGSQARRGLAIIEPAMLESHNSVHREEEGLTTRVVRALVRVLAEDSFLVSEHRQRFLWHRGMEGRKGCETQHGTIRGRHVGCLLHQSVAVSTQCVCMPRAWKPPWPKEFEGDRGRTPQLADGALEAVGEVRVWKPPWLELLQAATVHALLHHRDEVAWSESIEAEWAKLLCIQGGLQLAVRLYGWIGRQCAFMLEVTMMDQRHSGARGMQILLVLAAGHEPQQSNMEVDSRPARALLERQGSYCARSPGGADEVRALCEGGQLDKVLDIFSGMDREGCVPSLETYVLLLKACEKSKAGVRARLVCSHLARHGLESNRVLDETLVITLVKCWSLDEAVQVFHRLPHQSVFCWTVVISGYSDARSGQEAVGIYHCMREEGLEPDKYAFVSGLKACSMILDPEERKRILAEVSNHQSECDMLVGTSIVNMYGKCGSIVDARRVFDGLSQRNVIRNAMLTAYGQQLEPVKAALLYKKMLENGMSPNSHTFVAALQACDTLVQEGADEQQLTINIPLGMGKAIHDHAWRKGYKSHVFVGNCYTLISMYGKCGSITDAQAVFDGLPRADVVSWNATLAALTSQVEETKALELYGRLRHEGVCPDDRTFVNALQACGMAADREDDALAADREDDAPDGQPVKRKSLKLGQAIHADAWKTSYKADVFIGNTLVWMYGKCGSIAKSQHVFDGLAQRNAVSWNVILSAYLQQGQAGKVLQLYKQMQGESMAPNEVTLVCILHARCVTGSLNGCYDVHQMILVSTHSSNLRQLLTGTLIMPMGGVQVQRSLFRGSVSPVASEGAHAQDCFVDQDSRKQGNEDWHHAKPTLRHLERSNKRMKRSASNLLTATEDDAMGLTVAAAEGVVLADDCLNVDEDWMEFLEDSAMHEDFVDVGLSVTVGHAGLKDSPLVEDDSGAPSNAKPLREVLATLPSRSRLNLPEGGHPLCSAYANRDAMLASPVDNDGCVNFGRGNTLVASKQTLLTEARRTQEQEMRYCTLLQVCKRVPNTRLLEYSNLTESGDIVGGGAASEQDVPQGRVLSFGTLPVTWFWRQSRCGFESLPLKWTNKLLLGRRVTPQLWRQTKLACRLW